MGARPWEQTPRRQLAERDATTRQGRTCEFVVLCRSRLEILAVSRAQAKSTRDEVRELRVSRVNAHGIIGEFDMAVLHSITCGGRRRLFDDVQ